MYYRIVSYNVYIVEYSESTFQAYPNQTENRKWTIEILYNKCK